jgi:hypothetical protein
MHGVVIEVQVDASREEEARSMLQSVVVPRAKSRPGFVAGYYLRALSGNVLRVVEIFESEENARSAAAEISQGPPPGAPVTLVSLELYEVLATA